MEVLENPSTHFLLPHTLKNEPRIWGVCNEEARLESETAMLVPAEEGTRRRRREIWRKMLARKLPALLRRRCVPPPCPATGAPDCFSPAAPERSAIAAARRETLIGVANSKVAPLETARRWYGAMLTTCPNCLHVFDQPLSSSCCASRSHPVATLDSSLSSQGSSSPPLQPQPQPQPSPASHPAAAAATHPQAPSPPTAAAASGAGGGGGACVNSMALPAAAQPPLLLSATLQLPPSAVPTTCTLAVTASAPPLRALAGMAGGGIVLQQQEPSKAASSAGGAAALAGLSPQPSPSAPLSFVLPAVPGTPRAAGMGALPFQWALPTQPWTLTGAGASVHLNLQVPAATLTSPTAAMTPTVPSHSQAPQSDMDLERLASTMCSLRASGWYYEGLSWQESADLLQTTSPGTFLVRDSSDPRFLFSLSVQTERGPTSIRLHYVCGSFRLDAEPRLAPLMPLFNCVVKLVEYYVELTRKRQENKAPPGKEQVWVDARGQMYSHILLRSPLYKKNQLPNLQHLARLAINKQLRAVGKSATSDVHRLPLPVPLQAYIKDYPYMS